MLNVNKSFARALVEFFFSIFNIPILSIGEEGKLFSFSGIFDTVKNVGPTVPSLSISK